MKPSDKPTPLWRDTRFLGIFAQIVVLILVGALFGFFANNLATNFRLGFNLGLLFDPHRAASFDISDTVIPFQATDPIYKAILVGLLNSLRVMLSGIILATLLGILVGLGRLSNNWLVKTITLVYVDIFRNTPLLLQLFFWYAGVFLRLPTVENSKNIFNVLLLTNRGIGIVWPGLTLQTGLSILFLIISLIFLTFLYRQNLPFKIIQVIFVLTILISCLALDWQLPQVNTTTGQMTGGLILSPEFTSLLVGLTVYTSAFIAEVVRAGVASVNQGQWEAAKALGLKPHLVMQLVIFPQALRVIIPPLTSEFLNLAKNSSLASATLYKDVYAVAYTIFEKTGRALEMMLVVMVTYLIINLVIALGMNWFNQRVQIKER
jgi:general L-amino acid transport system permease protein